ncbi:DUF397 domain-containing protein [Actinomadura chokoriensis]|uniref:DUF397 domain-containing protein n=1 Tax=Actinomadura chokoriensis TaxID=454156 RepID=A0ABV4QT86_9ACTN
MIPTPDLSAVKWRKASLSGHEGGDCVEVAGVAQVVAVRDSKDPDGPKLAFTSADWRAFTRRVTVGVHDLA